MDKLSLDYYMAQTTVTINGTVTTHYDHSGHADTFDRISIVSIGVGADPSTARQLDVEHKRFHHADTDLDLHFGPDGRLAGAGFQSSGVGAEVIGAIVCMTSLTASVASGLGATSALGPAKKLAGDPKSAQAEWKALDERAEQLKTLVSDLQKRAIQSARKAAGEGPVPAGLADELKAVSAALDLARAEAAKVKEALRSWQVKHFPDATTAFTFVLGIDELHTVASAEGSFELDPDQLTGNAKDAAYQLHALVCRVDAQTADEPAAPAPASSDAITYRAPYLTTLAVYELSAGDGSDAEPTANGGRTWELRQVVPVWALGAQSKVRSATMVTDHFGKNSIHLEFGDSGALSHLTVADTGALANISNTISGVLGTGGSSSTPTVGDSSSSKPSATAPDPILAPLQAEAAQKQLEASIATANKTIRDSQQ